MRLPTILRLTGPAALGLACAVSLYAVWPQARDAAAVLLAQDDPETLSELKLREARFDNATVTAGVNEALAAGDADLAQSFVSLAIDQGVFVDADLVKRVHTAIAAENSASHVAKRFAIGFVTGDVSDISSIAGTVTGDLFLFGDIRDVVREGKHLASGEDVDHLVLGLASAGIAVTAATYWSGGSAAPARAGLSVVKGARRAGRLNSGLAAWTGRAVLDSVDGPLLKNAVLRAPVTRPGHTVDAIKAAFRIDKATALIRLGKDVSRVHGSAGTRAALDVIKVSDGPADVARAAKLAEGKGSSMRATLKVLGRGALLLTAGAWNLAMWLFGALLLLISFVTSVKATTERLTLAWCHRRRVKRLRAALAAA